MQMEMSLAKAPNEVCFYKDLLFQIVSLKAAPAGGHQFIRLWAQNNPPLGVEVVWEFQEFQELQFSQNNFKRREHVAKIKRRKVFDRHAFFFFRT